ncbi:carbon-phosphorus lyase complex subunit PhnI [Spirochaetia bacterium]|nr:carbon-phosphorus lyase complex subunit PhnI [Spirochaetia bacterium]
MAYVAVTGGREAVEKSIALLEKYRTEGSADLELEALEKRMGLLIDRIMGEAGFYAPRYAALALKQSEGSPEEAVFLLRAYRSTLSRSYRSLPLDGESMTLHRRISAAFKDIPGGQFLGAAYDYTHRLLNFDILDETGETVQAIRRRWADVQDGETPIGAGRVSRELREEGLVRSVEEDDEPWDITQRPLRFPAPRSARLQALARSDSGFTEGLAYAGIRGFGPSHPTVGELRTGTLEVLVPHPIVEGEVLSAGEIILTEVESFFPEEDERVKAEEGDDPLRILGSGQGDKADTSENTLSLGLGYGLVFGRNDNKAIAMSILDYMLSLGDRSSAQHSAGEESILQNQEFVLLHGDCLEMSGFISHLKLPHYVTFQSKLDRVRHTRRQP